MTSPRHRADRASARDPSFRSAVVAVAVAALGYGLVLPVLPLLVARSGAPTTAIALTTGGLMGAYTLASVLFAPLWGAACDRFGARAVLLASLICEGLALLPLWVPLDGDALIVTRVLQGALGAGVTPAGFVIANAQAGDDTLAATRIAAITRAALLGGLFAPALGGVLARGTDLTRPLAVTLAALLIAAVLVARSRPTGEIPTAPIAAVKARAAHTIGLLALTALAALAMGVTEMGVSLLGRDRFGLGSSAIGAMFSGCGLVMIAAQSALFRGERATASMRRVLVPAFALAAAAMALLGVLQFAWQLAFVVVANAASVGALQPAITYLIARRYRDTQGLQLGLRASIGGLGQAAGSFVGGYALGGSASLQLPVFGIAAVLLGASAFAYRASRQAANGEVGTTDCADSEPVRKDEVGQ